MTRILKHILWIILAITWMSLQACSQKPPISFLSAGASGGSDDWWFSAGNHYLRSDEPGLIFGLQKTPSGAREFAYVVLFRHEINERSAYSQAMETSVSFDGKIASMTDGVELDGKILKIELEIEANRDAAILEPKTFRINGADLDSVQGRVFLADFTADVMSYQQIDVGLPESPPDPTGDTETVADLARNLIEKLEDENELVRTFLHR
jgi:hypothetical protein